LIRAASLTARGSGTRLVDRGALLETGDIVTDKTKRAVALETGMFRVKKDDATPMLPCWGRWGFDGNLQRRRPQRGPSPPELEMGPNV
jgi:hypothetical protein